MQIRNQAHSFFRTDIQGNAIVFMRHPSDGVVAEYVNQYLQLFLLPDTHGPEGYKDGTVGFRITRARGILNVIRQSEGFSDAKAIGTELLLLATLLLSEPPKKSRESSIMRFLLDPASGIQSLGAVMKPDEWKRFLEPS